MKETLLTWDTATRLRWSGLLSHPHIYDGVDRWRFVDKQGKTARRPQKKTLLVLSNSMKLTTHVIHCGESKKCPEILYQIILSKKQNN